MRHGSSCGCPDCEDFHPNRFDKPAPAEPVTGKTKPRKSYAGLQSHFSVAKKVLDNAPAVAAPAEGSCTKCRGSRADRQHIHNPIVSWPTHDFMASTSPTADPQWRVGKQVPLNVYEGDRPVCQCHTEEDARRIVEAVNGRS